MGAALAHQGLMMGAGVVIDPYTKSLLNFNGTNGSTTITDEKGKTWVAGGSAQLSTSGPKFGSASGLLTRSGASAFNCAHHTDFNIAGVDAGFEFWYKPTTLPAGSDFHFLVSKAVDAAAGIHMFLFSGSVYVRNLATDIVTPVAHGMSAGTWYHWRFGKDSSGNNYLGRDGSLLTSGTGNTTNNSDALLLGAVVGNVHYADGRFDDFRWDNGINRYGTGSYTVPTSELTI